VRFRVAAWAEFPLAAAVLLLGLLALSVVQGREEAVASMSPLAAAPLWLVGAVGLAVPILEVLVWSVLFVEPAARWLNAPALGALAGVAAYSVLYHHRGGSWAIVDSAWVGGVVNTAYVMARRRSMVRALWFAVGLRWCFVAVAMAAVRGWI